MKNIDRAFVGRSSNAMGLQNATARKLAVPDLTTTVLTLTIVGIAADGHLVGESGPRAGRRFISVAAMFMGGFIGSLFILHGSIIAPLVIAFTVMAVIALYARARANKNPVWVSDSETLGVDGLIYAAHAFSSF